MKNWMKRMYEKAKPVREWALRHELIASCIMTLFIGLTFGGFLTLLDRWLVG